MRSKRYLYAAAAAAVVGCAGLAQAQTAPLITRDIVMQVDSGPVANQGGQPGVATVVYSTQLRVPNAPWVRLTFDRLVLAGDPELGNGSYLQITSVKDGGVQVMDSRFVDDWNHTTAYFNGDTVIVEVYAYPGTGVNQLSMSRVWAGDAAVVGPPESICGPTDDRALSSDTRQGRLMPIGCTAWLIDNGNCANRFLTAGHCISNGTTNAVVQFNVPLSTSGGSPVAPPPQDQFPVPAGAIQSNGGLGIGNDAAQFFTGANSTTGLHARVHMGGQAYTLASNAGTATGTLRVTGYGTTSGGAGGLPLNQSQVQKTHTGAYTAHPGTTINYTVDTTGGNSGSPVVNLATGLAIGIHTHGGCTSVGGQNAGTAVEHAGLQGFLANPVGPCAPMVVGGANEPRPLGEGGMADSFERANGPIGGAWSGAAVGNFSISGGEGTHTGGVEFIQNDAYEGDYRSSTVWIDAHMNGTSSQFVAVASGMGGSSYFYAKVQGQTGNGNFSHIAFYSNTGGPWTGGLPFTALGAANEFSDARIRLSVSPDGDTASLDIDTNFDGVADQTYTSSNLSSISSGFGNKFGLGAWQAATFDNWNATHEGSTDNFNRASGAMSGPWAGSAGTFANFSISGNAGTHTGGSDIMRLTGTGSTGDYKTRTQWVDAQAGSSLSFVGLCAGLGGTDNLFVKVQGTGSFSQAGFYHANNTAGWTGQTGGAAFFTLNDTYEAARIRVSVSADGDVATLDIDGDFDGVPDETHSRGGLNNISGSFGNQFGITAFGNPTFDNYALLGNAGDLFNRANGPIGGDWSAVSGSIGDFSISGNQGNYTGGATFGTIMNTGFAGAITDNSSWVDAHLDPGAGTALVALLTGLGGSDNLYVKIQNNGGASDFDRVFFYHGPTGGTGWPGMTPSTIFNDLATPVTSARFRSIIGPDGDTVTIEIDNNFDGVADESFSRTGLSSITHEFGNRYGLGAFGSVNFDNWKATPATPDASPCYPDCNLDGALNLADFGCFQTQFALGNLYADCNGDGVLNLADFGCFQTSFALGCP